MFSDAPICLFSICFFKKKRLQELPVIVLNLNIVAKLQLSEQELLFIQNIWLFSNSIIPKEYSQTKHEANKHANKFCYKQKHI